MQTNRSRREALAHHEAGHAIAALELKRSINYVTVTPVGDVPGHCSFPEPKISDRNRRKWTEREILILLSGPAAEAAFAGQWNDRGARGDFADAIALSSGLFESSDAQSAWLDVMLEKATAFVAAPRRQLLIRAVTAELLAYGTIGAKRVRAICRTAGNAAVAA